MPNNNEDLFIIQLSRGLATEVSSDDADLARFKFSAVNNGHKFYAVCSEPGNNTHKIYLGRWIAARILGRELLKGEIVKYIDKNPLNNKRTNIIIKTTNNPKQAT